MDKNLFKYFCNNKCQNKYYNENFKFESSYHPNNGKINNKKEDFYSMTYYKASPIFTPQISLYGKKENIFPTKKYEVSSSWPHKTEPSAEDRWYNKIGPSIYDAGFAHTSSGLRPDDPQALLNNESNRYQFLELSKGGNKDLIEKFTLQEESQDFPLCRNLVVADYIREKLKKDGFLYVVYDNIEDNFLGFSITTEQDDYLYIEVICTKIGVGAILLGHIKNMAIAKGKKYLKLESIDEKETFDFYIKNGFFINNSIYSFYSATNSVSKLNFVDVMKTNDNNKEVYMDLIINYNDILYNNKYGLEVIRSKVLALNKFLFTKFPLKNNYSDEEKKEINDAYSHVTNMSADDYDSDKAINIGKEINKYSWNHFFFHSIEMVKPLNPLKFDIVDRTGQSIVKPNKYDVMSDEDLLNELSISRKRRLLACKICQSFTGFIDEKLSIPFCDYKCQKAFYNK
jgi:hypothetical protein